MLGVGGEHGDHGALGLYLVERLADELAGQDFGEKVAKVRVAAKAFGEDKDCAFEAKVHAASLLNWGS